MDAGKILNVLSKELTRLERIADVWVLYKAKQENKLKVEPFKEHYIVLDNLETGARYLVDPRKQRLIAVKENNRIYVPHLGRLVPYKG